MKYIIGIDAGGTKTDCVIAGQDGNVLSEYTGEGCNPLTAGFEKAAANILTAVTESNKIINIDFQDVAVLLIGSTGVGREQHRKHLLSEIKEMSDFKNVFIETDTRIALEGAFPDQPGCILIAGTGSVIFGKDNAGKHFRSGGFGSLIGDQGGGYSIGRNGLTAVSKEFDCRGEKTILSDFLKESFNINNSDSLISKIYGNEFPIQDFAPYVIKAAAKKDKIAMEILDEESDELIEHIVSIKIKSQEEKINLAFIGSLISNKNYYSDLLKDKINKQLNFVNICQPKNSPVMGAILLAKKYAVQNI